MTKNYQQDILTNVVENLNQTLFQSRAWMFQQDSVPVYKVKKTQKWLENHVSKFISWNIGRQPAQTLIHSTTNCGQFLYKTAP